MAYQFIHVEAYARTAGKGKAGGQNISTVLAEAQRVSGNCPHVPEPQAPKVLFGDLASVEILANQWADQARDAQGHQLRKDGHCLLAGVISCPRNEEQKWPALKKRAMKWLQVKYGSRLKSVIEHVDESHPHVHFYVVPEVGERFEAVHEGKAAAVEAKGQGKKKGEQNTAYKTAMRGFQDEFSSKVTQELGFTRLGPGGRRLSRKAWRQEQQQAESVANATKVYKGAKVAGYNKGLKEGRAEGYRRGMEESQAVRVGEFIGSALRAALGPLHKPTANAMEQAQRATAKAEAERKKREKAEEEAREQVERELQQAKEDAQKWKRTAENWRQEAERLEAEVHELMPEPTPKLDKSKNPHYKNG